MTDFLKAWGADIYSGFPVLPVRSISHEHAMIHVGHHYICHELTIGLAASGTKDYLIVTPDDEISRHFLFQCEATIGGHLQVSEKPTTSANGTALSTYNSDRHSSNVSGTLIYTGPTASAQGSILETLLIGSGTNNASAGTGSSRDIDELELLNNTKYLLRVTNLSGSTAMNFVVKMIWYEIGGGL